MAGAGPHRADPRRTRHLAGPASEFRRAGRRRGVPRAVPVVGVGRPADCRFRPCDHPEGPGAARRASDCRLGAPDHRRCATLRAVRGVLPLPADPGSAGHGGARLHRRGDRLSRTRHRRAASVSRRRERGAGGAGRGACGACFARRGSRHAVRGLGAFAGRTGGPVHRHDRRAVRARPATRRCGRGGTGHRTRRVAAGRSRHAGRKKPDGDDALVLVPRLRCADGARRDAGRRSRRGQPGGRMHRVGV